MKQRLKEFSEDVAALTPADILNAADFNRWLYDYGTYTLVGGDRPGKKPPTPIR